MKGTNNAARSRAADHSSTIPGGNPDPGEWLSTQDAAVYVGVSPDTILDARRKGELKSVALGRRTIRFRARWIDAWLDSKAA